uniref:MAX dimerization protein 4 n=1 Tax=Oncorhynchus mykiss TaxID=8022 RepID=A0A8C7PCY7_ONCMY
MELNSLLILLEAAEYLERRDREAEHGYASVLPYNSDFSRKKTKASPISRKTQNNRSSHNELEKHRRAKLRLYLEQLKELVPLGPDSTRHTTLSLLKRAKMHIKKLEEADRKALNTKEQLQREHRYLKRRLEQLVMPGGVERTRTDSLGSTISTDSEQGTLGHPHDTRHTRYSEQGTLGHLHDTQHTRYSEQGTLGHPHDTQDTRYSEQGTLGHKHDTHTRDSLKPLVTYECGFHLSFDPPLI